MKAAELDDATSMMNAGITTTREGLLVRCAVDDTHYEKSEREQRIAWTVEGEVTVVGC